MASALSIDPVSTSVGIETLDSPPPELGYSSSKSSSIRSSSVADISSTDVANFEDISLDDLHHAITADSFSKNSQTRPAIFVVRPIDHHVPTSVSPNHSPPRDSQTRQRSQLQSLPDTAKSLKGHIASNHLDAEHRRRRVPSPSNRYISNMNAHRNQSRSPSPFTARTSRSLSRSSHGSIRWGSQGLTEPSIMSRRSSWQPGRKTTKELEDEYHDSDEEIPEDAVVWNVPISPRPPNARDSIQSTDSDSNPSQRSSPPDSPKTPKCNDIRESNLTPTKPTYVRRSVSMLSIMSGANPRVGTKSRAVAMSDLSAEARELTQALEDHAEERERRQEESVQNGTASAPESPGRRSVIASEIELPPLRRGDVMIDPLPVSKEKEKFLTRTRPSWLPPKDPKEEKRHLKEYQRMMAQSLKMQDERAKKVEEQSRTRDLERTSLARIWEQHVLPNWDSVITEPRTRELWWRGVTPRDRGKVWQRAVGNALGLCENTYGTACKRAVTAAQQTTSRDEVGKTESVYSQWFAEIERDVNDAFPELRIFQIGGPLHDSLMNVLRAFTMYRPDVGYVHGTHSVAALLLLNMDAPTAFIVMANLLNRPIPASFMLKNQTAIAQVYKLVLDAVAYKRPSLYGHLANSSLALEASSYLDHMFSSLFCSDKFGVDIASRIMDVYVFENDKMLVRTAVGTLMKMEANLYGSKEEILDVFSFGTLAKWELGKDDEFMAVVKEAGKIDSVKGTEGKSQPK